METVLDKIGGCSIVGNHHCEGRSTDMGIRIIAGLHVNGIPAGIEVSEGNGIFQIIVTRLGRPYGTVQSPTKQVHFIIADENDFEFVCFQGIPVQRRGLSCIHHKGWIHIFGIVGVVRILPGLTKNA